MPTITRRDHSLLTTATPAQSTAAPEVTAVPQPATSSGGRFARLTRGLATLAVLAAIGGVALWGHSSDWTLPKFSALVGGPEPASPEWCSQHNVPEGICIECNPELLAAEVQYGWCKQHGVANCPLEHPDVAELKSPPSVTPEMLARAERALALRPRAENNSRCALHRRRIQFASTQAADKVGLDIAVVTERPLTEAITAQGEVGYDQTRRAHLASRVSGTVWRVEKQIGDRVRKGEVLALVDAAEIGRAKSELLQAIAQLRLKQTNVERSRPLADAGTIPQRVFRESETALEEARIRVQSAQQALVNLGLAIRAEDFAALPTEQIAAQIQFAGIPAEMAASLDPATTTSNLFPLRSSLDGLVLERHVVEGEVVEPGAMLFSVADCSRMALALHVKAEDAKYISLGQKVLFRPGDSRDEAEVRGTVDWISTSADEHTRTIKLRVNLPNTDGRLRAGTFGSGRVVLREEAKTIVVPSEAVHWDGTCYVVFVRDKRYLEADAPKFYHVRSVRPGVKDNEQTEIIAGLLPGEVIASRNSVVLQAQLMKSNLGAGCGCSHGH